MIVTVSHDLYLPAATLTANALTMNATSTPSSQVHAYRDKGTDGGKPVGLVATRMGSGAKCFCSSAALT